MDYRKEITLEQLLTDYGWEEVFGEGSGGNCTQDVSAYDGTDTARCTRADVVEIIAAVNGENDDADWIGLFRLADGRFLAASGECDYTGWDCQAGNTLTVGATLESVIQYGLTAYQRERLTV
ncbi:hypothetical protein M0R72_10575 [Candidatus Pacearchaeota archaeon]|jgi:hypothetical protein|nr:hypothetical protein [Candidatus Pacearchaeota archaeon]